MAKLRNKIECIIFSDLHLNDWKSFNKNDIRLKNGLDVLRRIKWLCKKHNCYSVFAGDLLHKENGIGNRLLSKTLPKLSRVWGDKGMTTYGITGNHDQSEQNLIGKESPSYINTLSNVFPNLHCLDFKSKQVGDVIYYGVPYLTHDLGLIETVKNFSLQTNKFNVLILHTTLPEAKDTDDRSVPSNLELNEFEKAVCKFDLVICGHIHKPHNYHLMTTQMLQVGAPQQQRATDRNCKMGYWILYKNFRIEFVEFDKYPKFVYLKEGQKPKDDKNFYIIQAKKRDKTKSIQGKSIKLKSNASSLAKQYCKYKGIEDKTKIRSLKRTLKKFK